MTTERIERLCRADLPSRQLRAAILDELRRQVRFDFHVFNLTDPRTCVGCDPLADVPHVHDLPRLIRFKYTTAINRWTALGDPPAALLSEGTGGRPEHSALWRELLAAARVVDVASLVLRDRYGCWAFLDLWRTAPAAPFTGADARFLAAIAAPVTAALRRVQAATFVPAQVAGDCGAPVLLLDADLTIRGETADADELLRRLLPTPPDRSPIPAAAYNVAAQLLAIEAGIDDHPPIASLHAGDGVWLTLRAARIVDGVAVTIEHTHPATRLDIFSRACGLSDREKGLLEVLATGADTREAAARLHLSANTVQDYLKSIFDKSGSRSRRELLARALG